jgi:photosystem II stability/assembly factor-like uncharacterized protein
MKTILLVILFVCARVVVFSQTWQPISVGESNPLYSVFFINPNTGFISGGWYGFTSVLYKTTDGGMSWILCNTETQTPITSLFFTDENTGYAVGGNGLIIKTNDQGSSWNPLYTGNTFNYTTIFFIDAQNGILIGQDGLMMKTSNAGEAWNYLTTGAIGTLYDIDFVSQNTGYATGEQGLIIKTTDGGTTWVQLSVPVPDYLYALDFINEDIGYVVTDDGIILKTMNGGIDWTIKSTGLGSLYSIFMTDANNGCAVGSNGVFRTFDGGNHWIKNEIGTMAPMYSVFFLNNDLGYVVGDNGHAFKTVVAGFGTELMSQNDVFILSPTPAKNSIKCKVKQHYLGSQMFITNLSGVTLIEKFITEPETSIDIQPLPSGLYIFKIQLDGQQSVRKFLKM